MSTRAWAATAACVVTLYGPLLLLAALAHAHVEGCHTTKCDRRISAKRHRHYWVGRFQAFSTSWRGWAHSTSWCEANHRADTNTGNGFYGAFQYTLQTAGVAGFHRRPDLTTWHEQAVRSIRYAQRHGTGAWPVCG